jgi:hypothetical protein
VSPKDGQFQELWVRAGEKALSTLINGDRGFLIYFEADEDPGFTSRNPAYNAPADALI